MKDLKRHKWPFYWGIFVTLIILLILLTISFEDRLWIGNAIQTIGTIVGLYASILIFLQSREESDRQYQTHLEHMKDMNMNEIETLKSGTEREIEIHQEVMGKQIAALHELTERQIMALQKATEKQIDTIQKSTFEQINSCEKQTTEIVTKLSDNSILLAEILGRELEKAISQTTSLMQQAEKEYLKLEEFQIGRSSQQKAVQLERQR